MTAQTVVQGAVRVDGPITLTRGSSGIDPEDFAFGATEMMPDTVAGPTFLDTNGLPRWSFAAATTQTVRIGGFNFPDWCVGSDFDIHFAWTNEGADVVGTVVWAWNMRRFDIGDAMASAELLSTGFVAIAPPANGVLTVSVLDASFPYVPPELGSVLGFELGRLGGSDTIANAVAVTAVGFSHLFA